VTYARTLDTFRFDEYPAKEAPRLDSFLTSCFDR